LLSTRIYLSAEEEGKMLISQANIQMDEFWKNYCRKRNCTEGDFPVIDPVNVDYADVAPIKLLQFRLL
jgi:DNA-directed RNA polymerase subunit beta